MVKTAMPAPVPYDSRLQRPDIEFQHPHPGGERAMSDYAAFLASKAQLSEACGFTPSHLPEWLFDFQADLVAWALRKGRGAIFADCGLGKTPMQLVWSEQVARKANGRVLILTPLAVGGQTVQEGEKFGIECRVSREGRLRSNIVVTNYERLHYFNPSDFVGVVCDESSILKNFDGATKDAVTDFMRTIPYRLLCTATAAPNDYIELGTSSEALGGLGYMDMLGMFFKNDQHSLHPSMRGRYNEAWYSGTWRFKPNAKRPFWRWLCSWARALRRPSDLGFSDARFTLPPLHVQHTIVQASRPMDGMLFSVPAVGLTEQRQERRHTIWERCEAAAATVRHRDPAVVWCHLNLEGKLLERLIPDCVQVSGRDSEGEKEEKVMAFSAGKVRVLVSKPTICGYGLNWQHCAHTVMFPSHSFEQYYQSIRRFWRYGQTRPVTVDLITTEGESNVMANLQRKAEAAEQMFASIVEHMADELRIKRAEYTGSPVEVPAWLC